MISAKTFLKVFAGSFFIQSAWSFGRMQALGFASAIYPALKEIYGGGDRCREALKRHLAFYNAHPYMASPVLGASINIEERAARGECRPEAAASFKKMIMGPYGAIGDVFFWSSVRPLASAAGIAATLLFGVWGPVAFLLLYNLFHVWMRWTGLKRGLQSGEGVAAYVRSLDLPLWAGRINYITAGLTGIIVPLALWRLSGEAPGGPATAIASVAALGAGAGLAFALKKGVAVTTLVYAVVLPLVILGFVF